jgi:uncharacterized protein (DUF2252 family)
MQGSGDVREVTGRYEAWLRASVPVVIENDLDFKHQQMSAGVFPFLRATFYRWSQRWVALCPKLTTSPAVLGVGDLHVENYGTWRDGEGRLVWGINDFDEATVLPYTVDLVRLATSAALAAGGHQLAVGHADGAAAILAGYERGLQEGGKPFVLAEHHHELRALASTALRDPVRFWTKMDALPAARVERYPGTATDVVTAALPEGAEAVSVRSRRAGLGSLGRPRLAALAQWRGGRVARECKAMLPSAWDWATTGDAHGWHYAEIVERAVRSPDPATAVRGDWLVRRLAPDCIRIELSDLPADRDEVLLLRAMGYELANVHLGTAGAAPAILADLDRRHPDWLLAAAERMAADTEADWDDWRRG